MGHFYGIMDLGQVEWMQDASMAKFKSVWDHYVENLGSHVNIIELRNILYRQLEKSHCLKPDIAYYDRIGAAHPNKTYDFLYKCMVRWFDTQKLKRNRQAQENLQKNLKDKDKDPGRPTHSCDTGRSRTRGSPRSV